MSKVELFNGDCLSILPSLKEHSVDLVICDLPYGVLNKSNKKAQWDKPIDLNSLWVELKRVGKHNTPFVFFSQGRFTYDLINSNFKDYRYSLVWDKCRTTGFLNAKKQPLRQHEDILIFYSKQPTYNPQFSKGEPSHSRGLNCKDSNNNYGHFKNAIDKKWTEDKYPTSILRFEKNIHKLNHPTEKPVSILEYLIKTYSNNGDTVLDPTMGSGSCGEACQNTGRHFTGIELDPHWFSFAQDRLMIKDKE